MMLQEKIMRYVLKRQVRQLSDVRKILNLWKLCALSQKNQEDYECSDHLILMSLDFMEGVKV